MPAPDPRRRKIAEALMVGQQPRQPSPLAQAFMPNQPLSAYGEYGQRTVPPVYDRAQGNEWALRDRAESKNRVRNWMFDKMTGMGAEPGVADFVTSAADWLPGVGDASAFEDAYQAYDQGAYIPAGVGFGMAALGVLPMIGDIAQKGGKAANRSLRKKYQMVLEAASGGKDPMRMKLTPERINLAKELMGEGGAYHWPQGRPPESMTFQGMGKQHGLDAIQFVKEARAKGIDARIKFPDGPTGSAYVKMPDGQTIRFADHAQPTEWVGSERKVVGGFSKTLGRRHHPADMSVDPGSGLTVDDIRRQFLPTQPKGIRAYHGSPHDFDKFSLEHIGKGEGAQAYGHGLYFAENEGVANSYKYSTAARNRKVSFDGKPLADSRDWWGVQDKLEAEDWRLRKAFDNVQSFMDQGNNAEEAIKAARDWLAGDPKMEAAIETIAKRMDVNLPEGRMYEVNINANPEDFLDWDKPLSEQPKALKAIEQLFESGALDGKDKMASRAWADPGFRDHLKTMNGERVRDMLAAYRTAGQAYSGYFPMLRGGSKAQRNASELMQQQGIPGIKYLDQGSRAAGEGSRNYVVFDDNLIEIIKKYGIAGAIGLGYLTQQQGNEIARQLGLEEQS